MDCVSILRILSDGQFHSGSEIGQSLGYSRASVGKGVQGLSRYGIDVHSVKGKGYRLSESVELLSEPDIRRALCPASRVCLSLVEVLFDVGSTNTFMAESLLGCPRLLAGGNIAVCLAELQTEGRGRRGRSWQSPFGGNLYLTVAKRFSGGVVGLEGLSLVVGVIVVRALERFGLSGIGLKWPNDILAYKKKLCGVLLEMSGEIGGECQVVMGVGLNVKVSEENMAEVGQPWTDLSHLQGRVPGRNALAAAILDEMIAGLKRFEQSGFSAFREEWERLDCIMGDEVVVRLGDGQEVKGVARGVTDQGALLVDAKSGRQVFRGGEVSLKLQPERGGLHK